MPIEDVFSISGRYGCIGRIERGIVNVGEEIEIAGLKPRRLLAPVLRCFQAS